MLNELMLKTMSIRMVCQIWSEKPGIYRKEYLKRLLNGVRENVRSLEIWLKKREEIIRDSKIVTDGRPVGQIDK